MAKKSSHTNSSSLSAMAQLLASHKSKFVSLVKGESVKAKITKLNSSEILVDAGAKTEAIVLEKDKRILRTILGLFKVGDTVEVNVLNPESDLGQPIVSLRRYLSGMAWEKLEKLQKSKEQIEVTITEVTKAGYLVATAFGVSGFLPHSHASISQQQASVGQKISVSVFELNKKDNKIIFSQKNALSVDDFAALTKKYKLGEKVKVTVLNVTPFGLFVSLPFGAKDATVEGFIHISEAAWEKVDELGSTYTTGQEIEAVITRFDSETQRINLSIKRLTTDPFDALLEKFPIDAKVTGIVSKIDDAGVSVTLTKDGEEIEGLIKKEKVPPTTTYTVGQSLSVLVSEHDKRRHKITLAPVLLEKPMGYR